MYDNLKVKKAIQVNNIYNYLRYNEENISIVRYILPIDATKNTEEQIEEVILKKFEEEYNDLKESIQHKALGFIREYIYESNEEVTAKENYLRLGFRESRMK